MSICNIIDKIKKFMSSEYYIYFLAAIVFIFWCTPVGFVGAVIVGLLVGFTLFFVDDMRPFVAAIVLVVYSVNTDTLTKYMKPFVFTAIIPVLFIFAGMVYRLIILKKNNGKLTLGDLGIGLIIMTAVCMLGGVISDFNIVSILLALLLGGLCFVCYLIMVNGIKQCFKEYMVKLIITVGLLAVVQLFWFYLTCGDFWHAVNYKDINIGWGISNNIGLVCVVAIPMAIYFSIRKERTVLGLMITIVLYVGLLFTFSRGNILFGTALLPFMLVYGYIKSNNKKAFLVTIMAVLFSLVLALIFFGDQISNIFENMLNIGLDDRGRVELYELAMINFFKAPLFGVGFSDPESFMHLTHNTFLQMLESCGIIGFIGSSVYFFQRYKNIFQNISVFKIFSFAAILLFDLYGLMDVSYITVYLLFIVYAISVANTNEQNATPPFAVYPIDKKNQNGAVNAC